MTTIKELAEELGISKVSVSNRIDALGLRDELVKQGNRLLLSDEQAEKVRAYYTTKRDQHTPGRTQRNDDLIIQALTEQLQVKDEQIAMLQEQVATLVDNLADMNRSIQQSQFLLADNMGVIRSAEVDTETISQEEKQTDTFTDKIRFWSRRK